MLAPGLDQAPVVPGTVLLGGKGITVQGTQGHKRVEMWLTWLWLVNRVVHNHAHIHEYLQMLTHPGHPFALRYLPRNRPLNLPRKLGVPAPF